MKRALVPGLACLLLVAALLFSGCSTTGPAGAAPDVRTPADLAGFVSHAAHYAESSGRDAALATFSRKTGPFFRGDLYVYAYDFNGTLLAPLTRPDREEGSSSLSGPTPDGKTGRN
ncbi:MAG: hypothetical protein QHH04_07160 [Methanolinea sp.]|nr:hypothetical protein [Methanolinea sp.]